MTVETIQIILEVSIFLLGLYIAFFKSYLQEKGKNLATKEDIEDITEKIETVKSQVGLITHKKINIASEKHKTLLDFNGSYSSWLNYILHASISGDKNGVDLHITYVGGKLDQLFHEYLIAEAKLEVFFHDDANLINLKNEIKLKTMELSRDLSVYLLKAGLQQRHLKITNDLTDNDYKRDQIKKYSDQLLAILNEYKAEQLDKFKVLAPLNHQLIQLISDRVNKILD